jgi:hypothetical protein
MMMVATEDANYFLDRAERCFRMKEMAGGNQELAAELETMANEFMAKAVALDTKRDRAAAARSLRKKHA